jgi:DNA-binding XRE family transcriptional regulator
LPKGSNVNPVTLGDYLKLYRLENGYTSFEMSLELDVYNSTIYKWENNLTKPQGKNLNKIIEFMGFDPRT